MPSEDRALARCLGLAALGVVLMFVAHAFGFLGWMASEGRGFRPPYWWSYLILYPAAAAVVARATSSGWREAALCLCAPPIIYFLALGVLEGAWLASDGTLWASLATLALTALVGYARRNREPASKQA
jgi:hypothetical protein